MRANVKYQYLQSYIIEPVLKKFAIPETLWKYYIGYYIEGIMAIVKEWLKNDCQEPIETIISIIEECVKPFRDAQGQKPPR